MADLQNRARFGTFEVDLRTHEVWNDGAPLKLKGQPFEVLAFLLSRPGELVTRDELRARLWSHDTFVDFDQGLNAAVNKVREALSDSPDHPSYIQTLPRLGYRFISPVSYPDRALSVGELSNQAIPPRPRWQKIAALAVTVLLVAGVSTYLLRPVSLDNHPRAELTPVPLTTYPGIEFAPSFSPSGNEIAFEWHREDTPTEADLYVKQIGQENPVRLTYHHAGFLEPAWSRDGKKIAFVMLTKDGVGVYVLPVFGGEERRLADLGKGGYPYSLVSWSPDSKWVAFAKADDTAAVSRFRIHLINVETTEERALPPAAPECGLQTSPSISPDGKEVASECVLVGGEGNRLYVQPADGGSRAARLVANKASGGLTWSSDGKSIVYGADAGLWKVPAGGGPPEKLPFAHDAMGPVLSPGGRKLAYIQCNTFHSEIFQFQLTGREATSPVATRIATSTRGQLSPRISPDGKRIAFQSDRSGNMEIWVADRDGSNPVKLTSLGASNGTPRWSPDGKQLVFDSLASGHSELYTVNASGGVPGRIETGTGNASLPFWSSDGRTIYFSTEHPLAIWKVPASGGSAVQVTRENRYLPQESPDGKRLYYVLAKQPMEIRSMPIEGGEERVEKGMFTGFRDAAWVTANDGLYFVVGVPRQYSVGFYDATKHRVKKVADLPKMAELQGEIALSPDGRTLFYAGIETSEADIMLVENFK